MKKYRVLVRGENFLVSVNEQAEKLGFYTTVYVEALDDQSAELKTMELLRTDEKLVSVTLNSKSDSPMMYMEEIEELETFEGLSLPRTGFAFFPAEDSEGE
jgi:hypothetical protein